MSKLSKFSNRSFYIVITILLLFLFSAKGFAHQWMAPKEFSDQKNPFDMTDNSINIGKETYLNYCKLCHGNNAEGNKAKTIGLKKDPPNLKQRIKNHSDGDFFWKIQNGREEMPSFKDLLKSDKIWHVINYIKSLNRK